MYLYTIFECIKSVVMNYATKSSCNTARGCAFDSSFVCFAGYEW